MPYWIGSKNGKKISPRSKREESKEALVPVDQRFDSPDFITLGVFNQFKGK